jgi:site-specific DNA recombinase
MNIAVYVRVSTPRQAQTQTIVHQLDQLRAHLESHGWPLAPEHIFRDDGYSGTHLARPGLDRLRDAVAQGAVDRVLITAPDRLARKYVHQMLLLEEFERRGCEVEFLDRPLSHAPHDQLLLQVRGAVAEDDRAVMAERLRRGRRMQQRAGVRLPWTRPP